MGLFEKIFGTHSEKELKKINPIVDAIEALDEKMQALSDEELRGKTQEFKDRLAAGETLDDILVEAFAVVREAAYRVLGMKHYRVQLIGGIVLHQGRIAEMRTGEGKTLVSTLPAYLNALEGKGVHVVLSTTTWQSEMLNGWGRCMNSSDLRSESYSIVPQQTRDVRRITAILHMLPTTSSVSIT